MTPLREEDIEKSDKILRQHVRDRRTGVIVEEEIQDIKSYMRGGEDDYHRVRKYLVARSADNQVIGCIACSTPDFDMVDHFSDIPAKKAAELLNTFVDNEVFGGGGVGRMLFEGICNLTRSEGKEFLLVHSGPRYKLSWPFYDKMCDENREFIVEKYGPGGDANAWLKKL